jgi:protein-S-isoprenylcysteine O-methyltransferase Ste14
VISVPLWPTVFVLPLALCFYYFVLAGARTFEVNADDDLGSGVAQASFLSGTLGTLLVGYWADVSLWNAIAGGAQMIGALLLYEWARRTIMNRRFHIAWSGDVPDAVCRAGPYAFIRHPLYTSYMLAFSAMLAAVLSPWTLAIFAINVALFVHAARADERSIAASALADDYARYKQRVGMFLPRLRRKAVG